ncbi:MAG: hypothetical protein A2571_02065 [Candidatus Vogelbacteria bacterium RIFOXYD1_FULL_44_32]|uniref:Uncharacterized protein n=1 Tax=Candidatus Vogelbacteria bacterium RIFOXYD1_FULL_44_32 TaxID=1802438 RepID=A0A1G2QEN8_9BACT|nr:MAG: hypothetical protein A2571_02065 [Candidatus Vogelbacteria bacterium RIFOXYD1_FULL_44_32]
MKHKILFSSLGLGTYLAPLVVLAQAAPPASEVSLGGLLTKFTTSLVNPAVGILMTLAVVAFFWGLVKYIYSAGAGKDEGKMIMVWGVVALFVMVSVWGLVAIIKTTIFGSTNYGTAPTVNSILPTTSGGASGAGAIIPDYDPATDTGRED